MHVLVYGTKQTCMRLLLATSMLEVPVSGKGDAECKSVHHFVPAHISPADIWLTHLADTMYRCSKPSAIHALPTDVQLHFQLPVVIQHLLTPVSMLAAVPGQFNTDKSLG